MWVVKFNHGPVTVQLICAGCFPIFSELKEIWKSTLKAFQDRQNKFLCVVTFFKKSTDSN